MSKVSANMSMSLDGFVNHPTDGVDTLFGWYSRGDVVTETENDETWQLKTDAAASSTAAAPSTPPPAGTASTRSACRSWC